MDIKVPEIDFKNSGVYNEYFENAQTGTNARKILAESVTEIANVRVEAIKMNFEKIFRAKQ